MSTGVILPSYNVAHHLPDLLAEIKQLHPNFELLIVDDGSADETAAVGEAHGATVVRHPVNQGKGAALETGYRYAVDNGWEWAYTMDADGQHLPGELADFMDAAGEHNWDIVVGSRMSDTTIMPWLRKVTNKLTSSIISKMCGFRVPDSQSGYRLFRTVCLDGLRLRTNHYEAESEILVRLARRGYRIGAVPISTVYGDEKSSIKPLLDTWRFSRLVFMLIGDRN